MHNSLYFTDLVTLFDNTNERTVETLSKVYDEYDVIFNKIKLLFDKREMSEKIQSKRVLLKPNWVNHNRYPQDEICLRTHDQFLLAGLEVVLSYNPKSVIIADAPIQGGKWDLIVRPNLISKVKSLQAKYNIPVSIKDLRRVTFDPNSNSLTQERNPIEDYKIFDVGGSSFLEPISSPNKKLFRVTYYNPDRLAESHGPGMHKYCISRILFEADVVISLPKVKTHQKAGITAALKNIVGLNGDKDFLPHHRLGGTKLGGDCYPGGNYLRYYAEILRDKANRNQGKFEYWFWFKMSSILWKLSLPGNEHHLGASWYGNDTTWRMVMDLNKIAIYGRQDGTFASKPQRVLYSLCDGIIGGQGNGPLYPDPLPLGIISFTNHSPMNDICMGLLLGFDPNKISLLKIAKMLSINDDVNIFLNGKKVASNELKVYSVNTTPPPGWLKHLKEDK